MIDDLNSMAVGEGTRSVPYADGELACRAWAETDPGLNAQAQALIGIDAQYLDGGAFDLQFFIRRCRHSAQTIAQHSLYLGRDLIVIKERLDRFEFDGVLEQIGISPRSAQRFMQVAVKFDKPGLDKLAARLAVSKLIELAGEDDEELAQALGGGTIAGLQLDAIERMSTRELKAALRDAKLAQAAHDRVLLQKNAHADELAKKLALAEHRPLTERWPVAVAAYHEEISKFGADAELLLDAVSELVVKGQPAPDMPVSAQASIAMATVERVNRLAALVGEMQCTVFRQYGRFIEQPRYDLGDLMAMKGGGGDEA